MVRWKALVVDDSPTLRHLLVEALREIPELFCIEAADGAEGISSIARESIDLVITDLQMPNMSGFAFINFLRHRAQTEQIPIVVVTSAGTDEDQRKLEAAGIEVFLRKPVGPDQIVGHARALLRTAPVPP